MEANAGRAVLAILGSTIMRQRVWLMRMRAELAEVIVAAQRTVARSRALIAEVDAVLAREKSLLLAPRVSSFDAGR